MSADAISLYFRFDVHSLDFIEFYDPQLSSTTSSAHWRKEPGTNNLLNFHIKGVPGMYYKVIFPP